MYEVFFFSLSLTRTCTRTRTHILTFSSFLPLVPDLRDRDFTKARLRLVNFANANLQGISMFACFAEGSNFEGADLSYADLEQGNFTVSCSREEDIGVM